MTTRRHRLFIAGHWLESQSPLTLHSPFGGEVVAQVDQANHAQMEEALTAAAIGFTQFRYSSRFLRSRLLTAIALGIAARRADLLDCIIHEAGKPYGLADVEINRAIGTFTIASEEAKRMGGEIVPVDIDASGRAYQSAQSHWTPKGPVLAIAPFNFPLNLVAHKVAPALAVGASVVIKPPPQAPGAAVILAEIFEKAAQEVSDSRESVPLNALQVVMGPNDVIGKAVTDPRIAILSFTGSDKVGWMLQEKAARKRVALELGGNAAVIVHSDADLSRAAARTAFGAFAYAGQICISVQRILVQKDVADRFQQLLLEETARLGVGDPANKDTIVGPVIDSGAADRLMSWIHEATSDGAKIIYGGRRRDNVIEPTVLTGVKSSHKLSSEEAFGPVVIMDTYDKFEDAVESVNHSRFGLQAGVFTDSAKLIQYGTERLEVGGLIINEVPTFRADNMPYGGVKESGLGREGVRFTMEEFCERKTIVQWQG